jgi:hypothetical protein
MEERQGRERKRKRNFQGIAPEVSNSLRGTQRAKGGQDQKKRENAESPKKHVRASTLVNQVNQYKI